MDHQEYWESMHEDHALDRALEFKGKLKSFIGLAPDEKVMTDENFATERAYFIKNYEGRYPDFLRNCRTLADFFSLLRSVASHTGSWQARREYIEEEFRDFLNYLEFGDNDNQVMLEEAVSIHIHKEIFNHVKSLFDDGHYFNAVEEAYKFTRDRLRKITGKEKAHEAFAEENYEKIFGAKPTNEPEKDFFEGVKFLHMAIQKLRNEKSHIPAQEIDRNLALHYIALASLAHELISRKT